MPEYKPKKFKIFHNLAAAFTVLILLSLFIFSHTSNIFAVTGINRQVNFQGKLVNSDGTNVTNGAYTVIFSLYNHPSAGSPDSGYLWQESQSVTTTDGIFRAALGSQTAFPTNFNFNWSGLYLGLKVNSDNEMTPRIQMGAVPFAFNAERVAGLTVQDENGVASTSGILKIANDKTITFGNTFNSGTNSLTFTTTDTTGLTLPTGGTLLTDTSAIGQSITSTQTTGTLLDLSDLTGLSGAITGLSIGLTSTTDSQNKTGISFDLSGGSSGTYYDLYGTAGTWSITRAGALNVANCVGCGDGPGGTNYWNLVSGVGVSDGGYISPINSTADLLIGGQATSSAVFAVLGLSNPDHQTTASVSGNLIVMPNNGWGGNMGIGTTGPLAMLDIKDTNSLATLGTEKIIDPDDQDFTTDTYNWTADVNPENWAIYDGKANKSESGYTPITLANTALNSPPVAGHTYQITFTFTTTASSSGSLTPYIGGTNGIAIGQDTDMEQTETQLIEADYTEPLNFTPTTDWYGTIDDVSIMEITASSIALRLESSDGALTPLEFRTGGSENFNTFIGQNSGLFNTIGEGNTFLGVEAGGSNTIGGGNTFLGAVAGDSNTTGEGNTFLGVGAGDFNTTGDYNTFLGYYAGDTNTVGSLNTILGFDADLGSENLINAGAIGANAYVTQDNSLILGSIEGINGATGSTKIGIGKTAPLAILDVMGNNGSNALVSIDQWGSGDIFVASQGGSPKFVISNAGNVGIGTTSPFEVLGVTGNASVSGTLAANTIKPLTGALNLQYKSGADAWTNALTVLDNTGYVGIGTANPSQQLEVNGTVKATAFSGPLTGNVTGNLTGNADTVTGLSVTAGKTLTISKTMSFTAADDTGVYTLPTGTKTLLDTGGSIAGLTGTISSTVLGNSTVYIGTTGIALNRGSAAQGLTGITGLTPGADFTLSQNSVVPFTSVETGAVANTLYLKAGNVGIGTTAPGANLEVLGETSSVASVSAITSGYGLKFIGDDTNGAIIQSLRNGTLTIGGDKTGNIVFSPRDGSGAVTIGSTTNGLVFDVTNSGPTYYGTARPTKKIILSPEYSGATLTASGSATITGSMTADASPSASWRTYYEWSSSQTSLNDYTIVVRTTLPSDFSAWTDSNALQIDYNTELTTTDTNKFDVIVYNPTESSPSTPVVMRTGNKSASEKQWATLTIDDSALTGSTSWDGGGETAVFYIKLYSKDSNYVQVGDITLNYKAKF